MSDEKELQKAKEKLLRSLTKIRNKNKRLINKQKTKLHITQTFGEEQ